MTCFEGIVGLKEIDSNSLYWINDCTGITTELATYLQSSDNANLSEFWKSIKQRSWQKFYTNFLIAFHELYASCCKSRNEIDLSIESIICANNTILALSWLNILCRELILEKKHSSNINYFTTVNIQDTDLLIEYYNAEFDKSFSSSIKAIYIPDNLRLQETGRCILQTSFTKP